MYLWRSTIKIIPWSSPMVDVAIRIKQLLLFCIMNVYFWVNYVWYFLKDEICHLKTTIVFIFLVNVMKTRYLDNCIINYHFKLFLWIFLNLSLKHLFKLKLILHQDMLTISHVSYDNYITLFFLRGASFRIQIWFQVFQALG